MAKKKGDSSHDFAFNRIPESKGSEALKERLQKMYPALQPDDGQEPTVKTRAQAEAVIRSVTRTCRGPINISEQARWSKLMEEGKVEEARTVNTKMGCGRDFNDTIMQHPFDGGERLTTCPNCGIQTSWKSPVFPELG